VDDVGVESAGAAVVEVVLVEVESSDGVEVSGAVVAGPLDEARSTICGVAVSDPACSVSTSALAAAVCGSSAVVSSSSTPGCSLSKSGPLILASVSTSVFEVAVDASSTMLR